MKATTVSLPRILCAGLLLSLSIAAGAQDPSGVEYLRSENARLRAEVDSLSRVVSRLRGESVSTWDLLSDLEADDDITSIYFKTEPPVSSEGSALMDLVRKSAPSVASTFSPAIEKQVGTFLGARRNMLPGALGRYDMYLPMFWAVFQKYGIPEELISLCIVESAVSRRAVSPVGAAGIWQLMPQTARMYGLTVNEYVDERFDVALATDAAARTLRDMYRSLGSWDLTILAYNCGAARVRKAIIQEKGSSDAWAISKHLPAETKAYLPAFLAIRYIVCNQKELGITPIRQKGFPKTRRIQATEHITLDAIAKAEGLDARIVRDLNPRYTQSVVPAGSYYLLPVEAAKKQ